MTSLRASFVIVLCAGMAACAAPGPGGIPSRTLAVGVPADAPSGVVIGRSTKADVVAALGRTVSVPFDSGYEVWVYRLTPGKAEFVLLFDPAGVLARTRIRPAPAPLP